MPVTEEDVIKVQNEWALGVVKMGTLRRKRADCEAFANTFLNNLYAFEIGSVLFKPTKCAIEPFRLSKLKALSYFIAGDNRACEEDKGFALNPWINVWFDNVDLILEAHHALAMGHYFFTDEAGSEIKVEYTFGYQMIKDKLKINLHHSSLPYKH